MTLLIDLFQTIIIVGLLIIVHFQYKINRNNLKTIQGMLEMVKRLNRVVLGVDFYEQDL